MHLEAEQIQRLLHGELTTPAGTAVRGHLAACAECRLQLEEAQREEERILEALRRVDHPPPVVSAELLAARARRDAKGWTRWAAGIVLALAAGGAAYAAPGSPLPGWVDRVIEWVEGAPREGSPPSPSPTTPIRTAAVEVERAGVAVTPGERFAIILRPGPAEGTAAVSLTEGPNIVARAVNGTATFTTYVDSLTVETSGPAAEYEIEVPRSAAWVEIRAGERRLLLKEGSRITTDAPADAQGRYVLPLTSPGP